jgi:anthranilate synthase component 1
MQVVADTFPAGTLSGAQNTGPCSSSRSTKKQTRNFYGGAIGFMDFEGNFNHAIMIRTFLSKIINCIHKQVLESLPVLMKKSEMEEVYNKLRALNKA